MVRVNMIVIHRGLEQLLLVLGLLFVSVFCAAGIYTSLYSHATLLEFWHGQKSMVAPDSASPFQRNSGIPDFRSWSEKRIEAYHMSLLTSVPPPLGVLKIPSINLGVPVLQGTDNLTLNRAVGHIAGTGALGEIGNAGIAGHRDGVFRELKDVHRRSSCGSGSDKDPAEDRERNAASRAPGLLCLSASLGVKFLRANISV